jgi:hypothetical protein
MYVRPSAPRSIGGVLDDAIGLYRHSFSSIWPLTLTASVVMAVPGIFLGMQLARSVTGGPMAIFAMMKAPSYWLTYALILLAYLVVQGALITALAGFAARGQAAWGEALSAGVNLLPRMLAVSILFGLMISIGLMFLVIPGVYLWGIYQLAFVALIVERSGIPQAFGDSRRLIKGYWWRSATIITVAIIIVIVLSVMAGVANGVTTAVFGFGSVAAVVCQHLINAVLNVFLLPLLPCFLLAMYYDLKLRHEGGDLAARVDALAAQ